MSLVQLTLAQPREERERYLRRACAQDSELFKEVSKYVEWEERMSGFLLDPLYTHPSPEVGFKPSELLENRFRVVREVAHGGMGIVYEAVDEKLGRRIAIKCAKPGFRNWLPREVRHASEIGHPSVCRIFEIHSVPTQSGEIDFLTMEFLEGETLAERLQRGPIPQNETRAIAEQLCGGLAEAHRTGVIHGDLKSNNVILTTAVDGTVRAVITDFGLARGYEVNLGTIQSGTLRGTPDYMAPELWKGEKASAASDIYALGVILYELVSGHRPFGPEVSHQDRLTRKAPSLAAKWDPILAKCLDPDPLRRFANSAEVGRSLEKHSRRRFLWTAAATAASVAGVLSYIRGGPAENAIPSVAVLPFANAHGTPDMEFLSDGISEALINNLSQLPGLKVIARSSSFRFRPPGGNIRKISQALNAQALVAGSIAENAGRLRIAVELINADGAQIWGEQYTPTNSDLAAVQAQISHDIAERIRIKLLPGERVLLSKWANTKPGAYELLLRGRYQFRLYSAESRQKMISYYEQALAIDPAFALANAELAYSLRSLSGGGIASPDDVMVRAEAAAHRALAADANLAEGHLALAEIKKDRLDWDTAAREYQRALELNPNLAEAHMGYRLLDYTTISTRVSSVALSQDGSVLAAVDLVGGLYVFVGSAGGFPAQPSRPFFPTARRLYSVAVHSNGQWLAACGDRGRVHLLTISQQGNVSQPFTWIAPDRVPFLSVAIANTGDFFVVGGGNVVYLFTRSSMIAGTGPVARYNTPNGGTPQDVRWVAISGDGSLVSAVQNMGRNETGLLLTLSNTGSALNSKWQQALDHNPNSTSIDTAGQYVTAADGHPVGTPGKFYVFIASNGTKLWDYSTNNMNWPMAICGIGTAAAAGSDNGTLYYFLP